MLRYETNVKKAQNELDNLLGKESLIYKDNNLEECKIETIRLSSTLEEFILLLFEKAYIRPAFEINNEVVKIPYFLSVIDGNINDFLKKLDKYILKNRKNVVYQVNYTMLNRKVNIKYFDLTVFDGMRISDKLLECDKISFLRKEKRRNYIDAINKLLEYESMGLIPKYDNKLELVENLFYNNDKVIEMYHNFDYKNTPPKYFINIVSKYKPDIIAIHKIIFMNLLGFDVILITESGYDSFDSFISSDCYDRYIGDRNLFNKIIYNESLNIYEIKEKNSIMEFKKIGNFFEKFNIIKMIKRILKKY